MNIDSKGQSQSSNGSRRIVSASQAQSRNKSNTKTPGATSRRLSKKQSNMSALDLDDGKIDNIVTEGLLPNIAQSGRFSQTSKHSLQSLRESKKNLLGGQDTSMIEKKSLKSFQLADQFQAEDIIQNSQTKKASVNGDRSSKQNQQIDNYLDQPSPTMKDLENQDVQINTFHSSHNSQKLMAAPNIDFHAVRSQQQSNTISQGKQSGVSGSRKGSAHGNRAGQTSIVSSRHRKPVKKINAWETFEVNQFKERNQEPGEFINKLKLLTAHPIPFMGDLPFAGEMDSTDPLDSFIEAVHKIIEDKSIDFTDEVKKGIHLATGIRTDFCENLITFICHHQKLEQAFVDAVEFFMESLQSVVKLQQENQSMQDKIKDLLEANSSGIQNKYVLEKKIKEQQNSLDKITLLEKQSQNNIKKLQFQLQDKIAENDSLEYRLKHYEEITGMIEPPGQAISQGTASGGAVPNPADEDKLSKKLDRAGQVMSSATSLDINKIKDLQSVNKKLEEELQQLREVAADKDNSEHFSKIQELFNKIQIENKNLRIYNQKCESKLESKQNLINHLEDKVTAVMVDKEEIVIKLKSEIVLLKNKLELNEEKFKSKLEMQRKRLEHEFKTRYDDKIKELEGSVSDLDKQRRDLRKRLTRLHKEHEELSSEFNTFRRDKEEQESMRNRQYKQLEDKHSAQQDVFDGTQRQLKKEIEELENRNEVVQKENYILQLRQKYLKQQTETLAKQKVFLFETLGKGKNEIQENLQRMENAMMADNNNQAYLVSVEKCIKQAKRMADMGTAALQNISQILQFLKIEKLHQLLSDEAELEQLEKHIIQSMHDDQEEQRAVLQEQQHRPNALKTPASLRGDADANALGGLNSGLMIQRFLNKHGIGDAPALTASQQSTHAAGNLEGHSKHLPSQASGSGHQAQLSQGAGDKTEDYYLNNCPVELASICVKSLVDILIQVGMCSSVADVPAQVSQLLQQCNKKSDQTVEREILGKFLSSTKLIIDKQINELRSQKKSSQVLPLISPEQKQQIQEQLLDPSAVDLGKMTDADRAPSQQSEAQKSGLDDQSSRSARAEQARELERQSEAQIEAGQLRLKEQQLRIKLEEQKMKSRNLQLTLAGKIVRLEEQLEEVNQTREEQSQQLEKTHQEELQRITSGVEQREAQLLQLCDEYRDEVRDLRFKLETSWKPAEESKTVQKMEKGTRGNLYRLMKDEYERLFHKNSELLHNYQASINEFVYLREDLRGSFTLAFDCERLDDGLLNMLNEAMLKYYLSKTFVLDKSKFRFLRSEQLSEKKSEGSEDARATQIMKIIIEVVAEDQGRVSQLFKNVKAQIKDGTSLLYDFMPLYFGMNLGSSGFSTHHNLKDFALLSKTGQIIDGEEYVVSVMRNKHKPLVFKIIAFNLELREEFMMELSESDIYELVEGDQQVLKNLEPDALIKKITTNLNLIVRDKIKVLTCEQKIFFNEIWMQNMESGKNHQVHRQSVMETQLPCFENQQEMIINNQRGGKPFGDSIERSAPPMQSFLTHTAARTSQLSPLQHPLCSLLTKLRKNQLPCEEHEPPQVFLDKFCNSVGSQTDYEISTLYEGFENVYRGVQKVGEITHMRLSIQESTKTRTLVFTFDDLTSLKKLKFSLYEKASDDQYVVHSECMRITDGHHVLVAVEQIQQQGLLIKMYDMLECKSVNFSLLRKQNGQFTRLSEESSLDLLMKGDFRNFIYGLTFVVNKEANENLMQNMQYLFREDAQHAAKKSSQQMVEDLEQKKQMESLKRENAFKKQASGKILPRRKRALYATRVYSFSQKAFFRDKWSYLASAQLADGQLATGSELVDPRASSPMSRASNYVEQPTDGAMISDWRDSPGEKGTLLYRNIFIVRCIFDGAEETSQESVITLYLKDMNVNIEVSLYKEQSKMSIASSVHALDLFGDDPMSIPFKERIVLLNSMMEKFFIISEDSVYHMKVESEAVPVQTYLEEKRQEAILKNPKENKAQEYDVILTAQRIRLIQDEKEQFLANGQAVRHRRLTDIDGEVHKVEMLFLKKTKAKTEKAGGRRITKPSKYGKSEAQKTQIYIEQHLEDHCDWDSIYFEIVDQNNETVAALYEKKKLSMMLSKDEFFDWKSALSNVDPHLLDYIQRSIKVDKLKSDVSLHNKENIEQNIFQKFRKVVGGKYLMRLDLELQPDEQKIVQKQMISNTEIEMSEFLYDIKIFQIQKISDKDIIAYQIEIFTLNDPDVVYLFNYPMNFSSETHDPHTLVIDVVNLIEHPLTTAPQSKKGQKLQSKGTTAAGAGVGAGSPGANAGQYSKPATKEGGAPGLNGLGGQAQDAEGAQAMLSQQQKAANNRTTFQQLFRKYIDNRVLLFIQESRFPRKLDFILAEPCSQLQWRYHIEPRQITTGMASMHLADQATLEMFVAVLLDENEHCNSEDEKLFEFEDAQSAGKAAPNKALEHQPFIREHVARDWAKILEVNEGTFVRDCLLPGNEIVLSISKKRNAFCIEIQKPTAASGDGEEAADVLEIRVDPHAGDSQLAKVLREQGLSYCLLLVKVVGNTTTIKIARLSPTSIETVLKFVFVDEKTVEHDSDDYPARTLDTGSNPIFTAKDLQATTVDALRRYYGAQTMEQAMRMCQNQQLLIDINDDDEYEAPTIFEQMEAAKPSVHKTRMLTRYMQSLETKTVILHRKTFYDDQHEKLILMYIQLKYVQSEYQEPQFTHDVEAFNVVLQEPESGQETIYVTPLHQCLTPEELLYEAEAGNLRDMRHLKRLSTQFLDDRVHIRRIQNEESDDMEIENGELAGLGSGQRHANLPEDDEDRTVGNYTFDITFGRDARAGSNMEASARTSNADRNGMGQKDSHRFDPHEDPDGFNAGGHMYLQENQDAINSGMIQSSQGAQPHSPNEQMPATQFQQSTIYEEEDSNDEEDQYRRPKGRPNMGHLAEIEENVSQEKYQ